MTRTDESSRSRDTFPLGGILMTTGLRNYRLLGTLELAFGGAMVGLCALLIIVPFIAPFFQEPRGDLDMFGLVGGMIFMPLALSLFVAGRALRRSGWLRVQLQLLPLSAFGFMVICFWWLDRGSLLGQTGNALALLGLVVCVLFGARALGTQVR